MALVTVQRSPSPSNSPETLSSDLGDGDEVDDGDQRSPVRSRSFSESYLAVKGAALILPQSECARTITKGATGEIQSHLQYMFYLLRPQDTIKVAVKLESQTSECNRYLAVVSTTGRQDTEESVILGLDILSETATIGMVLPIWGDMKIRLDGDGGFSVTTLDHHNIFKPVSVQAMWSALQTLIKVRDIAQQNSYHANGLTHTWVSYYDVRVKSSQSAINEWNAMEDIESHRADSHSSLQADIATDKDQLEKLVKTKLKEIMMTVDLEEVTSKFLRIELEKQLSRDLREYRSFIDEEMIIILRQMDAPSEIFEYLYLGSEWNASNLEELRENGIGAILNVTREIDNFFPGMFDYYNVRLWDVEQSELLKYWDDTYKFIKTAKLKHSKVLVHCKMGVSRSASTVIAYAMKEYGWSLEQAHKHVRSQRSCIKPNAGFMKQLITYQGILDASKQRHNMLFRSVSTGKLEEGQVREMRGDLSEEVGDLLRDEAVEGRPRSWSPEDSAAQLLMKAQDLGTESESSVEEGQVPSPTVVDPLPCKNPLSPFLFTIENWDELDISSRSADSLDDILDARQAHAPDVRADDPTITSNVVLLSYRPLEEEECTEPHLCGAASGSAESAGESGEEDALGSGSEVYDSQDEKCVIRPQRGCYDLCMLTGHHTLLETPDTSDGEEPPDGIYIWYLHPDTKLETIQSQFRKQRRIAQLLRLSERKEEEERVKIVQAEKSRRQKASSSKLQRTNSSPLLPTKVMPDDYWIRAGSASDDPGDDGIADTSPEALAAAEGVCDADPGTVAPSAARCESEREYTTTSSESCEDSSPAPVVMRARADTAPESDSADKLGEPLSGSPSRHAPTASPPASPPHGSPPAAKDDPREGDTSDSSADTSSDGQKEIGVWQHYEKEDIPWSPGTVKRQTLDLEEKIKSKTSGEGTRRMSVSSESSTECPCEAAPSEGASPAADQSEPVCPNMVECSASATDASKQQDGGHSRSYSFGVKLRSSSLVGGELDRDGKESADTAGDASCDTAFAPPDFASPPRQSLSDGAVSPYRGDSRETSIYDAEEIPLEPGLVRRTKLEFEQRERSSSYAELEGLYRENLSRDGRPVQRSSSWKAEKITKSKNRDADRRKTCLPVLQFSPLSSRESSVHRETQMAEARKKTRSESEVVEEKITVVKVGTEDVEVKEGQVKRRTKDFEKLTAEERLLLAVLDPPSRPRSGSHSPFVEDCSSIPSGSVKQHTKHIETKYAYDPAGDPAVNTDADSDTEAIVSSSSPQPVATPSPIKDAAEQCLTIVPADREAEDKSSDDSSSTESASKPAQAASLVLEGATTDSSTDEDKYEAIRTESMPTLLLVGVAAEEGTLKTAGIVKQHKQAIESKAREDNGACLLKKVDGEEEYKMGPELLTMIRRVGRTLVATPKADSSTPSNRVKKVAMDIEGAVSDSGYRYYQNRMVIIEKDKSSAVRRLDLSSPLKGTTSLGRSASLKEKSVSPGVPPSQVGRSFSLRESVSAEKKVSSETDCHHEKPGHVGCPPSGSHSPEASSRGTPAPDAKPADPAADAADDAKDSKCDVHGGGDEDCPSDSSNESRAVVKDLVGIFEVMPVKGEDGAEAPNTPPRGTTPVDDVSPKSPSPEKSNRKSSTSPVLTRKRASSGSSTAATSSVRGKTSRVRTKSDTRHSVAAEKGLTTVAKTTAHKSGATKGAKSAIKSATSEPSAADNMKLSREPKSKSPSPRAKDRMPVARGGEEKTKSRLSPSDTRRGASSRSPTSPSSRRAGEETRTRVSPSTSRVRADSRGSSDDNAKPVKGRRLSPRLDITGASARAGQEAGKRSPKSSSPSPSPPAGGGKPARPAGARSPATRNLFPDTSKSQKASPGGIRKGSLPTSRSDSGHAAEAARPRTQSSPTDTEHAQCTRQPPPRSAVAAAEEGDGITPHAPVCSSRAAPAHNLACDAVLNPLTGQPFIPISSPDQYSESGKPKARRAHGKSHPLAKLKAKNSDGTLGPGKLT